MVEIAKEAVIHVWIDTTLSRDQSSARRKRRPQDHEPPKDLLESGWA